SVPGVDPCDARGRGKFVPREPDIDRFRVPRIQNDRPRLSREVPRQPIRSSCGRLDEPKGGPIDGVWIGWINGDFQRVKLLTLLAKERPLFAAVSALEDPSADPNESPIEQTHVHWDDSGIERLRIVGIKGESPNVERGDKARVQLVNRGMGRQTRIDFEPTLTGIEALEDSLVGSRIDII